MQLIFRWFYCLTIPDVLTLMAFAGILFLCLRNRLKEQKIWHILMSALLLVGLGIILQSTLLGRGIGTDGRSPSWQPFASYRAVFHGANRELLRTNFMNVILFFPAGLAASELLPKRWNAAKHWLLTVLLLCLVSVGIELCQYFFQLGKGETDDIIHNTLGAALGALLAVCPWNNRTFSLLSFSDRK